MKSILLKRIIFLGLVCLSSFRSNAQENKIDSLINNLLFQKKLAGAAIAVLKNQKVIFDKNYGYADIEDKKPVTEATSFNIMSVTKCFVAIAVVQLADKGKMELDAPVKEYLSNLPDQYGNVLIYQLLNHSSGVPDYVHEEGYMAHANRTQSPMEVIQNVINKPLNFKPGEKNEYSNSGYYLLGLAIEKVTGKKLSEYLKENVFEPSGMNDTYLEDTNSEKNFKAKGYTNSNGELKSEISLNPSQYWAAGGIVSTKNDLIKWNKNLMSGIVLPKKEIDQMMQPLKLGNGTLSEYGLGFELMNSPTFKVVGNNGVGLGFNASDLNFLNDGLTVLVLTNTSNSNSSLIAKNIRDIYVKETGKNTGTSEADTKKNSIDAAVNQVLIDASNSSINPAYFEDISAINKFKSQTLDYIKSQGKLLNIHLQGQKVNPQTIVRKYEADFEKGKIIFVFIFSNQGRIMLVNHMQ